MKIIFFQFFMFMTLLVSGQEVVERYTRHPMNTNVELLFYDDSTFMEKIVSVSCLIELNGNISTSTHQLKGRILYRDNGNRLVLVPEELYKSGYGELEATIIKDETILKTDYTYTYQKVRYKQMDFLFRDEKLLTNNLYFNRYKNDFYRVASEMNKRDDDVSSYRFYQKTKASTTFQKDIKSSFPKQYQSLILTEPIKTRIKNFLYLEGQINWENPTTEQKKRTVIFDKGANSGIREGMAFFPIKKKNGRAKVIIERVYKNSSEGTISATKSEIYQIGAKFSTKFLEFLD